MTEPLPCPFCGHVGLSQYEGSTFRWLATECNGCGAQCGEERIDTMTMERSAAIEQAKVAAIETWNTRAEQQAEPVQEPVSMRMPKVGDRIVCLEDESLGEVVSLTAGGSPDILFDDGSHGTYLLREFAELFGYAEQRQQQAEPVVWDIPSASFNEWWDSDRHDNANPFEKDSAAWWAWAGWKAAQRQWVGLTDEEVQFCALKHRQLVNAYYDAAKDTNVITAAFEATVFYKEIAAALKERNHD